MSRKYKFHNPDGVYFVTFAVQGWVDVFTNPLLCSRQQLQKAEEGVAHIYTTLGITATVTPGSTTFIAVPAFIQQAAEPEQYYFHPDHLGSSSYITTIDGTVSQHMEYFAFGETFVEEHKNSHNSPYKYNGKELDEETGWYYYGARYYDPRISLWLGVDPMEEKYRRWSPYNYCMDNPMRFIDPDGMGVGDPPWKSWNESGKYSEPTVNRYGTKINVISSSYDPVSGGNSNTSSITGSSSNIKNVSDKSAKIIANSMESTLEKSVEVTSTTRSPEKQASIMYDNIKAKGVENQKNLYGPPGERVIATYVSASAKKGVSTSVVQSKMTDMINEVGPQNVSNHCGDNSKLNVIDIAPSSVSNVKAFQNDLKSNQGVSKVIPYQKDPAIHLEIPQ